MPIDENVIEFGILQISPRCDVILDNTWNQSIHISQLYRAAVPRQSAAIVGAEKSEAPSWKMVLFSDLFERICIQSWEVAVMNSLTVNLHLLFVPWFPERLKWICSLQINETKEAFHILRCPSTDHMANATRSCMRQAMHAVWIASVKASRVCNVPSMCLSFERFLALLKPSLGLAWSPEASAFGSDYFAFESQVAWKSVVEGEGVEASWNKAACWLVVDRWKIHKR